MFTMRVISINKVIQNPKPSTITPNENKNWYQLFTLSTPKEEVLNLKTETKIYSKRPHE